MANLETKHCCWCKEITFHTNDECSECKKKEEDIRIAKWNALTSDEKLQDLRQRIEGLERGPVRFG